MNAGFEEVGSLTSWVIGAALVALLVSGPACSRAGASDPGPAPSLGAAPAKGPGALALGTAHRPAPASGGLTTRLGRPLPTPTYPCVAEPVGPGALLCTGAPRWDRPDRLDLEVREQVPPRPDAAPSPEQTGRTPAGLWLAGLSVELELGEAPLVGGPVILELAGVRVVFVPLVRRADGVCRAARALLVRYDPARRAFGEPWFTPACASGCADPAARVVMRPDGRAIQLSLGGCQHLVRPVGDRFERVEP